MLRNYFKIAIRNLFRNSIYSTINIGGLAIGIAASILIMLWVWDEVSYNRFHENADQLGQFWVNDVFSDKIISSQAVPYGAYEFFKTYDPRIKKTATAHWPYAHLLSVGENKVRKEGQFASVEFLEMFKFPLLKGSASTALKDPGSIVLTESMAKILFADQEAMGQIVRLDNEYDLKVSAILKDLPANSSFQFNYLVPWSIYEAQDWIKTRKDNWDDESFQIFVELVPGASIAEVNKSLIGLLGQKRKDSKSEIFIHPLKDWRLYSQFKNGKPEGGMANYVKSFALIAVLILVIACINFMNLATARSERRAREVGIRKSIGSKRSELISQFIGESIFITCLAFAIALVLVELALPLYSNFVHKTLFIPYQSPIFWLLALSLILGTGFFAGSYPALYLSAFNPVSVLKGKLHVSAGAVAPRKALVSLQFFFSIFLIAGMIVIYMQIKHVQARETGYDRESLITINSNAELSKNFSSIKQELLSNGAVQSITVSSSPITEIYGNNTLDWSGKPVDQDILFARVATGYDYTRTMGIKMVEGRDFSEDFKSDSSAMLLNNAAADAIGVQNPVGLKINLWSRQWTVIGVMEDVVMSSPFRDVQPGFFLLEPAWGEVVTVRLNKTDDMKATISQVEKTFKRLNPSYPFEYQFVDEQFNRKFASINLIGTLASLFALLAIFITCLGLVGLANFSAEQRTKEIGIRKVMGATHTHVVTLLSRDFIKPVLIGFAMAAPVAWLATNRYLEQYAYRVEVAWWIIPTTGLVALTLTIIIVSSQAWNAASNNPVKSLRSE